MKQFNNWSETKEISDLITNPLIQVGRHSYYSGYYTNQNFENGCVRYLWGDETTKDLFNPKEMYGWQLDQLIIGNYVCIASGAVILMGGNHNHHADWLTVYPFLDSIKNSFETKGDTIIKSDAWIGMNALIMPGITIGEGAIIAAGAVVTKDVSPYTIVGGNPAKKIKQRFSDETIIKLLEMRWFDWTDDQVREAESFLMSSSVDDLYNYYQTKIKLNR